jgi:hypothetical protein
MIKFTIAFHQEKEKFYFLQEKSKANKMIKWQTSTAVGLVIFPTHFSDRTIIYTNTYSYF